MIDWSEKEKRKRDWQESKKRGKNEKRERDWRDRNKGNKAIAVAQAQALRLWIM